LAVSSLPRFGLPSRDQRLCRRKLNAIKAPKGLHSLTNFLCTKKHHGHKNIYAGSFLYFFHHGEAYKKKQSGRQQQQENSLVILHHNAFQ
jgi:hypothetical protein